jgi:DNA-binding response OmpR family regulator
MLERLRPGRDDFCPKPVRGPELVERIDALLAAA